MGEEMRGRREEGGRVTGLEVSDRTLRRTDDVEPKGGEGECRGGRRRRDGLVIRHASRSVRRPRVLVVRPPRLTLVLARRVRQAQPIRLGVPHTPHRARCADSTSRNRARIGIARSGRIETLREGRRGVGRGGTAALDVGGVTRTGLGEVGEAGGVGRLGADGLGVGWDGGDGVVGAVVARVEAGGEAVAVGAGVAGCEVEERRVNTGMRRRQRRREERTILSAVRHAKHVPRVVLEAVHRGVAVVWATRLAELNHARLEVGEGTFDEALLLLVVGEEVVPEGVLRGEGLSASARNGKKRRKGSGRTLLRTLGLPRMTRPYFARVSATFNRRGSFKNPMP